MKLEDMLGDLSKVSDKEILSGHQRLHQWFALESESSKEDIIKAHANIFLQFVSRGLHHTIKSKLDDQIPDVPSDLYQQITSVHAVLELRNSDLIKHRHASLHDIWLSEKVNKHLSHPPEDLYNPHDLIADKMEHHPFWDELDKQWEELFKQFSFLKSESDTEILDLGSMLIGFPHKVALISDAVSVFDKGVYLVPGIDGVLKSVIQVKISRRNPEIKDLTELPVDPHMVYNLSLIRHGFDPVNSVDLPDHVDMDYSEEFVPVYQISSPFIYVVGSIVENKVSTNDTDVLVKKGIPDWLFQHIASMLVISHTTKGEKLHILMDEGLGPLSDSIPLYDLVLERCL